MKDARNENLQRAASYASVTVALILVGTKIWAVLETGSVSILSSLVDSMLDVAASLITLLAVRVSLQPADKEHRFGHGKAEGLAALAQSLIIAASALFVFGEAVQRLLAPRAVERPEIGLAVMALSIGLTLGLVLFQRYVVRQTDSMAIGADAMHYQSDLLINFGVAISIPVAAWTSFTVVDPLIGILVALYILWTTYEMATDALDVLLDRELPVDERRKIKEIALDHSEVRGFHDLRTRYGGNRYFIQFHLELDAATTLFRVHEILDEVEDKVRKAYPGCDLIVHADPEGFDEHRDHFS